MILKIYGGLFDLDSKLERKIELDNIINSADFWSSSDREIILKENNSLNDVISNIILFMVLNDVYY